MAFNQYLGDVLLIDNRTRNALNDQGLTAFEDFITLTEDDITKIGFTIRRPGGTLPNPLFDANNPVPGVPPIIPNFGISLGFVFERRLKMLRWYVHHLVRVQRAFNVNHSTLARLHQTYALKEQYDEEDNDKVALPEKLKSLNNVRQVIENIDNYLNRK